MKNIYKSFALLCIGLAAVACIEENFEENTPKYDTTPGNEIVFSATAGIENGMPEPETKTVYGDQGTDKNGKKWIEINWDGNKDMIQIVSPDAAGPEVGHYRVGSNTPSEGFSQTHQSASVTKLGDGALQWSESDEYTFYGVYPSFAYDSDNNHGATASLTKDGLFTGSMPIDQNYTLNDNGSAANGWIASPDMRYAFMTASDTYKREPAEGEDNRKDAEKAINLEFKSMVTALQFDIKPGVINYHDPVTDKTVTEMEVISVSLLSSKVNPEQTGKSISGSFNYNIPNGEYSSMQGTRMVSLHFDNKSVKLSSGGASLNVTLFILPEDFDSTDKLQLQIIVKLGATQVSRIATINTSNQKRPIVGGKKYIFNNVQLPELKTDVVSSSWWDTLDPDTILPQISIPVAANVFANKTYLSSISDAQTQQSLSLSQLWAMGVRGFEIQTQGATVQGDKPEEAEGRTLESEGIVAAGRQLSITFGEAFKELTKLLTTSTDASGNPTECLFLICTYSAYNDGYNPYVFVSNLFNYLDKVCNEKINGLTTDNFEQIGTATTVGDLKGKIAIIIRPGDDERWLYETTEYKANTSWLGNNATPRTNPYSQLGVTSMPSEGLTGYIPKVLDSEWWGRVMYIPDWGAESFDVWDRRYGSEYAREAVFHQKCPEGRRTTKKYIENYLYGIQNGRNTTLGSTSGYVWVGNAGENNFNNYGEEPTRMPDPLAQFNFNHLMPSGNTAYVQEWMRVVATSKPVAFANNRSSDRTLWVQWQESLTEKQKAIRDLFNLVVKTRGEALTDIYINVLSGYLVDHTKYSIDAYKPGFLPQKDPMDGFTKSASSIVTDHGKGGDFAGLSSILNEYVYNLLVAEPGTDQGLKDVGPWGLVMIDNIKANDKSSALVDLIMMNNFKFEMAVKPNAGGEGTNPEGGSTSTSVKDYDSVYLDGQNAISFE